MLLLRTGTGTFFTPLAGFYTGIGIFNFNITLTIILLQSLPVYYGTTVNVVFVRTSTGTL
jgi:hypothetical protein